MKKASVCMLLAALLLLAGCGGGAPAATGAATGGGPAGPGAPTPTPAATPGTVWLAEEVSLPLPEGAHIQGGAAGNGRLALITLGEDGHGVWLVDPGSLALLSETPLRTGTSAVYPDGGDGVLGIRYDGEGPQALVHWGPEGERASLDLAALGLPAQFDVSAVTAYADGVATLRLVEYAAAPPGEQPDLRYYSCTADLAAGTFSELTPAEAPEDAAEAALPDLSLLGLAYTQACIALEGGDLLWLGSCSGETALMRLYEGEGSYTTLTVATLDGFYLRQRLLRFNAESETCKLALRDYGERPEPLTALLTDIGAGDLPDLIDMTGLPQAEWAGKLLVDLMPLLDADAPRREALVPEFLAAQRDADGGLYSLAPRFYLSTIAGPAELGEAAWDLDAFSRLVEANPGKSALGEGMSRADFLSLAVDFNENAFIDWEAGTCAFDSPAFAGLLELAAAFPEEAGDANDAGRIYAGEQLLRYSRYGDATSASLDTLVFRGDVAFLGFPCAGGSGTALDPIYCLGVTNACADPAAAWEAIAWLVDYEAAQPGAGGFALTRDYVEAFLALSREHYDYLREELGACNTSIYLPDGQIVLVPRPGPEVVREVFDRLIASTDRTLRHSADLCAIVLEEAGAYFAGDLSAEQAAGRIQQRALLYVAEKT